MRLGSIRSLLNIEISLLESFISVWLVLLTRLAMVAIIIILVLSLLINSLLLRGEFFLVSGRTSITDTLTINISETLRMGIILAKIVQFDCLSCSCWSCSSYSFTMVSLLCRLVLSSGLIIFFSSLIKILVIIDSGSSSLVDGVKSAERVTLQVEGSLTRLTSKITIVKRLKVVILHRTISSESRLLTRRSVSIDLWGISIVQLSTVA